MKSLLMCLALASFPVLALSNNYLQSDFKAHIKVNGGDQTRVDPGKPISIELYFTDPSTNEVYTDFKIMHGKIMHMVLIKKDLSVFRHIHPYYDPVTGRFQVTLNVPYADPDNQHAVSAISDPGMYMLMADVDIRGVGMRMAHIHLHASGQSQTQPVVLDPIDADMSITKYFHKNPANSVDSKPFYKARLSSEVVSGCMVNLAEMFLELYHLDENDNYVPVSDLEPWLGEGGHAIWVSETLMSGHKTHFAHMHSEMPVDDHILLFNFFDKSVLLPGKQKIWIQFRHDSQVMTLPFVFEYYPPPVSSDNC